MSSIPKYFGTIQSQEVRVPTDIFYAKYGLRSGIITGSTSGLGIIDIAGSIDDHEQPVDLSLTSMEGETSFHSVLAKAAGISDPYPLIVDGKGLMQGVAMQYSIASVRRIASLFIVFDREVAPDPTLRRLKTIFGGIFKNHCRVTYSGYDVAVDAYKDFGAKEL